jgi:hypothetical protein
MTRRHWGNIARHIYRVVEGYLTYSMVDRDDKIVENKREVVV